MGGWKNVPAIACGLVLTLGASPARAQRTTYTNFNTWYMFGADLSLAGPWSLLLDVQDRRSGPIRQTQSVLARPALVYALTPDAKVAFGVMRAESYPYGKIPLPYAFPEWRTFEQLLIAQRLGRFSLTHRYRVEQRWIGHRGTDTTNHEIDHFERAARFRYQLKAMVPLHGTTIEPHHAYLTAYDELMVGFGAGVALNTFDQNRASFGIGVRSSTAWREEFSFLEQTLLRPNGRDLEQNRTLTFGLYYTR